MFGFTRRRRFEDAVLEEMAYMLDLHGLTPRAVEEARARRPGLPEGGFGSSRKRPSGWQTA